MLPISSIFNELKRRNIPCTDIMHLGANFAQGRQEYRDNGVKDILWVEAIPELARHLSSVLSKPSDTVLQAVLSDTTGQVINFNIASNRGMSSSVFEFKEHTKKYPHISMEGQISLSTTTLDDVFTSNQIEYNKYTVMIMDLQGSELRTLRGAAKILPHIFAVIAEVSCVELYKDAPLECDIDRYMAEQGFSKLMASYTEYQWGEALYIRERGEAEAS